MTTQIPSFGFATPLPPSPSSATQAVVNSLRHAAAKTGVSFEFLVETATRESSLNPNARAQGSSAAGLFQFVEQTWLAMVKTYGDQTGLHAHANAITKSPKGAYTVDNPALKAQILDLRFDPAIAATMAASLANENRTILEAKLERQVTDREVYLAHFLGAGNAAKLLNADDGTKAAELFPAAARANPAIFFANGIARTTGEVLNRLGGIDDQKPGVSVAALTRHQTPATASRLQGPLPSGPSLAVPLNLPQPVETGLVQGQNRQDFGIANTHSPFSLPADLSTDLSASMLSILLLFDPLIVRDKSHEKRPSV